MLSRSSIMVLCFGRDYKNSFLHVSLHKDLHVHGTHCMQIILMSRFQLPSPFPRLVSPRFFFFVNFSPALYYLNAWNRLGYEKCFVSKGYITIFKLIYLFWFKIEQTLPGFGVTRFTSACVLACFLSPFRGSCATWLRRSLNSKTLSTAHNGKTNRGRPG